MHTFCLFVLTLCSRNSQVSQCSCSGGGDEKSGDFLHDENLRSDERETTEK